MGVEQIYVKQFMDMSLKKQNVGQSRQRQQKKRLLYYDGSRAPVFFLNVCSCTTFGYRNIWTMIGLHELVQVLLELKFW